MWVLCMFLEFQYCISQLLEFHTLVYTCCILNHSVDFRSWKFIALESTLSEVQLAKSRPLPELCPDDIYK